MTNPAAKRLGGVGGTRRAGVLIRAGMIPLADDFLRRESGQREDGLRRTAFQPKKSNGLKYYRGLPHVPGYC